MVQTIHVKGMTCAHCQESVTRAVKNLNGVSAVEVHLHEGTVDVTFDESKVSLDQISKAIEDQGYDVVR